MRRREFITLLGSAAAAWPLVARAQQQPIPVIGVLSPTPAGVANDRFAEFRKGLQENGFTEGENVAIEYRWADGHLERLPSLVMDLVRSHAAVIFTTGGNIPALIAKGATATIPIVFSTAVDPIRSGLVTNLNRPDRNATGATLVAGSLGTKRIGLLRELAPKARKIGMLINPNDPDSGLETVDVQAAVQAMGEQISVLEATNSEEINKAFATLGQMTLDGLLVNPDPVFLPKRDQIVALAAKYRIPTIYYAREYVAAGGLMSYGGSFLWVYRQCGIYVARILKGDKPADLPVMQPTKFELVINAKTAKTLDLSLPNALLATADEVIE